MRSKRATLSSPVTHNKHRRSLAGHASLLRLDLHRLARVLRRARNDNEIPLRRRAGALRNLTDGTYGVDDGGAGRMRHEPSQRFSSPGTFWIIGERQHARLLVRQSGPRGLHHLNQALIEERHVRCRLGVFARQRELHVFRRYTEWLQVLRPIALWNRVRNIGDALRRLPYWNRIDYLVFERVDRCSAIGIFQSDIDPRAVAGRP